MKQSPTNKLTDDILKHLYEHGVFAWREDSNPVPVARKGIIEGFRPPRKRGKPDIMGILPDQGRTLGVEIKVGKDRLRPEQIGFHQTARMKGAAIMVVKDWDDYIRQITPLLEKGDLSTV